MSSVNTDLGSLSTTSTFVVSNEQNNSHFNVISYTVYCYLLDSGVKYNKTLRNKLLYVTVTHFLMQVTSQIRKKKILYRETNVEILIALCKSYFMKSMFKTSTKFW